MRALTSPTNAATSMTTKAVDALMRSAIRHAHAGTGYEEDDDGSQQDTGNPANDRYGDRFAQQQPENPAAGEADGPKDGDFAGTLADRHRHSVSAHEQCCEYDGTANGEDKSFHVAEHGDEIGFENLFALALGGDRTAMEHVVDGMGGFRHIFGRSDASEVEPGSVFEPADRFLEIFRVEIEIALRRIDGVDAAQREIEIGGKNVALDVDVV